MNLNGKSEPNVNILGSGPKSFELMSRVFKDIDKLNFSTLKDLIFKIINF